MTKVVLVSDNHFNSRILDYILSQESTADLYLHCGDSELTTKKLTPFASVRGNNDYDTSLPRQRLIDINGLRVLVIHGDHFVSSFNDKGLVDKAKKESADVVFFGHIHRFCDYTEEGIRFINPGSCNFNRDGTLPCYAIVTFEDKTINVKRIDIDPAKYMR